MRYEEIKVGDWREFARIITPADVVQFADLTGDKNKLHMDASYGQRSRFGKNISHGMLAASLFSTLVGMHLPGEGSLYLSQSAQFKKPIFPGDQLAVRGTVTAKNDSIKLITIKTEIFNKNEIVISGEAKVTIL